LGFDEAALFDAALDAAALDADFSMIVILKNESDIPFLHDISGFPDRGFQKSPEKYGVSPFQSGLANSQTSTSPVRSVRRTRRPPPVGVR
jgi:hypothetical protein